MENKDNKEQKENLKIKQGCYCSRKPPERRCIFYKRGLDHKILEHGCGCLNTICVTAEIGTSMKKYKCICGKRSVHPEEGAIQSEAEYAEFPKVLPADESGASFLTASSQLTNISSEDDDFEYAFEECAHSKSCVCPKCKFASEIPKHKTTASVSDVEAKIDDVVRSVCKCFDTEECAFGTELLQEPAPQTISEPEYQEEPFVSEVQKVLEPEVPEKQDIARTASTVPKPEPDVSPKQDIAQAVEIGSKPIIKQEPEVQPKQDIAQAAATSPKPIIKQEPEVQPKADIKPASEPKQEIKQEPKKEPESPQKQDIAQTSIAQQKPEIKPVEPPLKQEPKVESAIPQKQQVTQEPPQPKKEPELAQKPAEPVKAPELPQKAAEPIKQQELPHKPEEIKQALTPDIKPVTESLPKQEIKVEPKQEPEIPQKSAIKQAPPSQSQPEIKQLEPLLQQGTEPPQKQEIKIEPKQEPEVAPKQEVKQEPEVVPKAEVKEEPEPKKEADLAQKPEVKLEPEAKHEPEVQPKPEIEQALPKQESEVALKQTVQDEPGLKKGPDLTQELKVKPEVTPEIKHETPPASAPEIKKETDKEPEKQELIPEIVQKVTQPETEQPKQKSIIVEPLVKTEEPLPKIPEEPISKKAESIPADKGVKTDDLECVDECTSCPMIKEPEEKSKSVEEKKVIEEIVNKAIQDQVAKPETVEKSTYATQPVEEKKVEEKSTDVPKVETKKVDKAEEPIKQEIVSVKEAPAQTITPDNAKDKSVFTEQPKPVHESIQVDKSFKEPEVAKKLSEVATEKSDLAKEAPEVTKEKPEVDKEAPEVTKEISEIAREKPEVAKELSEVAREIPELEEIIEKELVVHDLKPPQDSKGIIVQPTETESIPVQTDKSEQLEEPKVEIETRSHATDANITSCKSICLDCPSFQKCDEILNTQSIEFKHANVKTSSVRCTDACISRINLQEEKDTNTIIDDIDDKESKAKETLKSESLHSIESYHSCVCIKESYKEISEEPSTVHPKSFEHCVDACVSCKKCPEGIEAITSTKELEPQAIECKDVCLSCKHIGDRSIGCIDISLSCINLVEARNKEEIKKDDIEQVPTEFQKEENIEQVPTELQKEENIEQVPTELQKEKNIGQVPTELQKEGPANLEECSCYKIFYELFKNATKSSLQNVIKAIEKKYKEKDQIISVLTNEVSTNYESIVSVPLEHEDEEVLQHTYDYINPEKSNKDECVCSETCIPPLHEDEHHKGDIPEIASDKLPLPIETTKAGSEKPSSIAKGVSSCVCWKPSEQHGPTKLPSEKEKLPLPTETLKAGSEKPSSIAAKLPSEKDIDDKKVSLPTEPDLEKLSSDIKILASTCVCWKPSEQKTHKETDDNLLISTEAIKICSGEPSVQHFSKALCPTKSLLELAVKEAQQRCEEKDLILTIMTDELSGKIDQVLFKAIFDDITKGERDTPDYNIKMFETPMDINKKRSQCINPTQLRITQLQRLTETILFVKWTTEQIIGIVAFEIYLNGKFANLVGNNKDYAILFSNEESIQDEVSIYVIVENGRCYPEAVAITS